MIILYNRTPGEKKVAISTNIPIKSCSLKNGNLNQESNNTKDDENSKAEKEHENATGDSITENCDSKKLRPTGNN